MIENRIDDVTERLDRTRLAFNPHGDPDWRVDVVDDGDEKRQSFARSRMNEVRPIHPLVAQLAALGLSRNAVISNDEAIDDMGFEAGANPIRISAGELRQRYKFPDTLVLT